MGKLHSPYRSRASSGLQQRTQPMAFPIYRAKPVALFGQGIQCTVLPHSGHKQQDVKILGPIWLTCQGREANFIPSPMDQYNSQSQLSRKPDQRTQATAETILQHHTGKRTKPVAIFYYFSVRGTLSSPPPPHSSGYSLSQN